MKVERKPDLIAGVLPAEGLVLLTADAKCVKSTLSLELCRAVATGAPALEHFPVLATGPCLYWQADDTSIPRFARNYQEVTNGKPLPHFSALVARLPLAQGGSAELEETIRRTGAKLAIVDCLAAVRSSLTKDFVGEQYEELRALSEMAAKLHACIVALHHLASGRRATSANPFQGNAGPYTLNAGVDGLIGRGPV